jgi:hypothetical protein
LDICLELGYFVAANGRKEYPGNPADGGKDRDYRNGVPAHVHASVISFTM